MYSVFDASAWHAQLTSLHGVYMRDLRDCTLPFLTQCATPKVTWKVTPHCISGLVVLPHVVIQHQVMIHSRWKLTPPR